MLLTVLTGCRREIPDPNRPAAAESAGASSPALRCCLLLAESIGQDGEEQLQNLVSFEFEKGVLRARRVLLSTPAVKRKALDPDVRYDLGVNLVLRNRYVITGGGAIIDAMAGTVLTDEACEFVGARGENPVFLAGSQRGRRYMIWNFERSAWETPQGEGLIPLPGLPSPNRLLFLDSDVQRRPIRIFLRDSKAGSRLIERDAGEGTIQSPWSSEMPDVPLSWIDDTCFLFACVRALPVPESDSTRAGGGRSTVAIFRRDLREEHPVRVAVIENVPPAIGNASFRRDPEGCIIYRCAAGDFEVDLEGRRARPCAFSSAGHSFAIEIVPDGKGARSVRFGAREIGRFECHAWTAATCEGCIAVAFGKEPNPNCGSPDGVKVWNSAAETWTTIDTDWLAAVIGWIER